MLELLRNFAHSIVSRLLLAVGAMLFLSIGVWVYFSISFQSANQMESVIKNEDRVSKTILLGAHYAMLLNSRDDIREIILNTSRQPEVKSIRIINKQGEIKFSNRDADLGEEVLDDSPMCSVCHTSEPPRTTLDLDDRTRIFNNHRGHRFLGIVSPIHNEPQCSVDPCHYHPKDKKILGVLDLVVSLEQADSKNAQFQRRTILSALAIFVAMAITIFLFILRFVNRPIKKVIAGTHLIAKGGEFSMEGLDTDDELGNLARSINSMGREIRKKQDELNTERRQYQNLFEGVPCLITVQDRNYRLLSYNSEFAEKFDPKPGDYCYHAYKGRDSKCPNCPVEETFKSGSTCCSEEEGVNKDGSRAHWIVSTSPIRDEQGNIVAAMEMSLDITPRKVLEEQLEHSEKKYSAIFENIPNPVFVLDIETLTIVGCNDAVVPVYGYSKSDLYGMSFLELFVQEEREHFDAWLRQAPVFTQARQLDRHGLRIYVDLRVSPCEYPGRKVLLVTASDVTKRLETEQQLIQASKMATLGEMATGVAHELNQPLSVIKTASSFFIRKVRKGQAIKDSVLRTMAEEIDSHVVRATKIINHLREFGRKSDMALTSVDCNAVLRRAFEIFSQQLKLRSIEIEWQLEEGLPAIKADGQGLEQVFINLLINARDAIESKWESGNVAEGEKKRLKLASFRDADQVVIVVEDSGPGIPKPIMEKIFEPFFTTKDVGKGTGLGLSISYRIVEDSGGSIRAESMEGKGARFIMSFPVEDTSVEGVSREHSDEKHTLSAVIGQEDE